MSAPRTRTRPRPQPAPPTATPVPAPPESEAELLARAHDLAGRTVGELGAQLGTPVPADQRRAKGLTGTLVERLLGATAKNRAEPDFPALGIELKTIPLGPDGAPRESTFVCSIELCDVTDHDWPSSRAHHKLARVLWVPVQAGPALPLPERRFGRPLLWSPSPAEQAQLAADWNELTLRLAQGEANCIRAHHGRFLQVRPKAPHSKARRRALDENAAPLLALPVGFYLRARFTHRLFAGS